MLVNSNLLPLDILQKIILTSWFNVAEMVLLKQINIKKNTALLNMILHQSRE